MAIADKPRPRRPKLPSPLTITTEDGSTVTLNDPATLFASALARTEADAIKALGKLIDMDVGDCDGKDETAKVSAACRILDLLSDKDTQGNLMAKLEPLRHAAVDALQAVARKGSVASARANASSYLLKAIRAAAPDVWPPDSKSNKWMERMKSSEAMCAFERKPL